MKLFGQDQWVQGFHWSVKQSSVFIKCTYNTSIGINISATNIINSNSIATTGCNKGIVIASVVDVQIYNLLFQS